jgi:hypothetical protein
MEDRGGGGVAYRRGKHGRLGVWCGQEGCPLIGGAQGKKWAIGQACTWACRVLRGVHVRVRCSRAGGSSWTRHGCAALLSTCWCLEDVVVMRCSGGHMVAGMRQVAATQWGVVYAHDGMARRLGGACDRQWQR